MGNGTRISRRRLVRGIAAAGVTAGVVGTASGDQSGGDRAVYIVLAGGEGLQSRIERVGFDVRHEIAGGSLLIVEGPAANRGDLESIGAVVDVLANETYTYDDLERGSAETIPREEPLFEKQWDKRLTDATTVHDRATGDGTTLAVVDSGVSYAHPDLGPRIDTDRSRLFRNGRVHAGTGEVTVAEAPGIGYKPVRTAERPVAADVDGHGTHVAGIAAAGRNDTGIVGTAPDATIVSLRSMFFEELDGFGGYGSLIGTVADLLLAIDYAAEIGADVINVSLGGPAPSGSRAFAAYRRVIQYAIRQGSVVVAAAGNQGTNLDRTADYFLPADDPGAVTVASTGPNDRRVFDSNYGDGAVDVAAPGGGYETFAKTSADDGVEFPYPTNQVLSSVPEAIYGQRYDYSKGTSMAAPQVAGLACLLRETAPDRHPRRIAGAIANGAVDLSGEYTSGLGAGRIDAPASIDRL